MADTSNLSNYLKDIANAIRTKKETSEEIPASEFDNEILSIETGGSGDVKLFNTEEEMQADETAKEGDLAVVYESKVQNWDGASAISTLIFPKTVVLPEAATGTCYGYVESNDTWINIQGDVTSTEANFYIQGGTSVEITYTSEDGLTYTRTDSNDETITITDVPVTVRMMEWVDTCGYFMQAVGCNFSGLFEYVPYTDTTKYLLYNFQEKDGQKTTVTGEISRQDITTAMDLVKANNISSVTSSGSVTIAKKTDDIIEVYYTASSTSASYQYKVILDGVLHIGFPSSSTSDSPSPLYKYVIDLTTNTITSSIETPTVYSMTTISGSARNVYVYPSILDVIGFTYVYFDSLDLWPVSIVGFEANTETNVVKDCDSDISVAYGKSNHYDYANSQLSTIAANDVLPGKVVYGQNGVVTGDDSIYDNLDVDDVRTKLMQIESSTCLGVLYDVGGQKNFAYNQNKLYGFRLDDQGKYGKMMAGCVEKGITSLDLTQMTYKSTLNFGYICIYKNKLYMFTNNGVSTVKHAKCCTIYEIDEEWNLTYEKTVTWSNGLYAPVLNNYVTCVDGKVYIAVALNVAPHTLYVELQVFDLETQKLTVVGNKKIITMESDMTTVTVKSCQIDVENTSVYTSYQVTGKDLAVYVWNWNSGKVTNRTYTSLVYNSVERHSYHPTYTYDCAKSDTTEKYNTIHIINKTDNSIATTIEVPSSSYISPWFISDNNVAYFYSDTYVMSVDLSTLSVITINEFSTPLIISSTYANVMNASPFTNCEVVVMNDIVYINSTGTYGVRYILNLADLTLDCCCYPCGGHYNYWCLLLQNSSDNNLRGIYIYARLSTTYYRTVIERLGSMDDFGNGLLGCTYAGNSSWGYTFYTSSNIPYLVDILSMPMPYISVYNTALNTAKQIEGSEVNE